MDIHTLLWIYLLRVYACLYNMITNILDEQLVVSWYLTFSSVTTELDLVVEGLDHMVGFLNLHGNVQRFVKWSSG